MKSTTLSELRNNYLKVLKRVAKREEVGVTRRGKIVSKVVLVALVNPAEVDLNKSAAFNRKAWSTVLSKDQCAAVLAESRGN